jgi:hypothetical protein
VQATQQHVGQKMRIGAIELVALSATAARDGTTMQHDPVPTTLPTHGSAPVPTTVQPCDAS